MKKTLEYLKNIAVKAAAMQGHLLGEWTSYSGPRTGVEINACVGCAAQVTVDTGAESVRGDAISPCLRCGE